MGTNFVNKPKTLINLILSAGWIFVLCTASYGQNEEQETFNFKTFGDVKWEYYAEEPIHPQLLVELNKQQEKYPDENSIKYGRDGHLYTTFIVTRLAGYDLKQSYLLSYFSQLPDDEWAFSAVRGAFYILDTEMRRLVMSTLHSLHGGDTEAVVKRRGGLQNLLAGSIKEKTLQDWQLGIITHAFADSFAHTYEKEDMLVAYDFIFGHAMHGHRPDTIAFYPDKYREFVLKLYEVYNVENRPQNTLDEIFDLVSKLKKNRSKAVAKFAELAQKLGFDKNDYEKEGKQVRDTITRCDIIEVFRIMERHLGITEEKPEEIKADASDVFFRTPAMEMTRE